MCIYVQVLSGYRGGGIQRSSVCSTGKNRSGSTSIELPPVEYCQLKLADPMGGPHRPTVAVLVVASPSLQLVSWVILASKAASKLEMKRSDMCWAVISFSGEAVIEPRSLPLASSNEERASWPVWRGSRPVVHGLLSPSTPTGWHAVDDTSEMRAGPWVPLWLKERLCHHRGLDSPTGWGPLAPGAAAAVIAVCGVGRGAKSVDALCR